MRRFYLRDADVVDRRLIEASPSPLPYGLLTIAATAEINHKVRIYDRNKDPRSIQEALSFGPDVVGVSVMTGPCILDAIQISEAAKSYDPDVTVVWGGIHPTFLPAQVLANPNVDYVLKGHADLSFPMLLDLFESGKRLDSVPGLVQKIGRRVHENEEMPFISDLNALPFPAWHLVDVKKYFRSPYGRSRGINVNTSRGCPFNCAYCYNLRFNRRQYTSLDAPKVIEQILYLQERYGIDYINFLEDNFTCNRARLRSICNTIISEKIDISWECESRVGYLKNEDYELMKAAGCVAIGFGVESGSPRILRLLRKGITPEQTVDTFRQLARIGLMAHAYVMVGLPTETIDDFKMTLKLIRRISPRSYTDMMMYRPYPGTDLYDYCVREGLFSPPANLEGWADTSDLHSWTHNLSLVPDDLIMEAMIENRKRNRIRTAWNAFVRSPSSVFSKRGLVNLFSIFRALSKEL